MGRPQECGEGGGEQRRRKGEMVPQRAANSFPARSRSCKRGKGRGAAEPNEGKPFLKSLFLGAKIEKEWKLPLLFSLANCGWSNWDGVDF